MHLPVCGNVAFKNLLVQTIWVQKVILISNKLDGDHAAEASTVTAGHGGVHVINSNLAWQTKVNEAKTTRKVVSWISC